jgi:hypothetical protein
MSAAVRAERGSPCEAGFRNDASRARVKIISPTDCIKDRLSWFYHSNDRQCLEQAVLVAQDNPVDLSEIRRWSEHEGKLAEFEQIKPQLRQRQGGRPAPAR